MRPFLICTTPRSGSTLLGRTLAETGVAGFPDEHFFEATLARRYAELGAADFPGYWQRLLAARSTPNGVFAAKLMGTPDALGAFLARLRELPGLGGDGRPPWEIFEAALPGVRYVWLTRRDKVRQAVSLARALRSGVWQSTEPAARAGAPAPELGLAEVDDCLTDLVAWDAAWEEHFAGAGARPVAVVYEDFVRDPEAGVRRTLAALDLEAPPGWKPGPPARERLADERSEALVRAFRSEAKRARSGARRRAAAVEARSYIRPEQAAARELAARVPAWSLAKALAWRLARPPRPRAGG